MRSLNQLPFLSSLLSSFAPEPGVNKPIPLQTDQCPNPPTLSCPFPPPSSINTCCVNHPSGHFLQTQFWDTSPPVGPNASWTIHGLWPDLCAGGFDAFCDSARSYTDIRTILRQALEDRPELTEELLEFMSAYWLSIDGNDEHLWAHEWNKHGTCISTLEPDCYPRDRDLSSPSRQGGHLDVLDYFVHATSLFKTLDTFSTLADAGIIPSQSTSYTLAELEAAVETSAHGFPVTFRCNRRGELDEVWYHFSVMGPLRHSSYYSAVSKGASVGGADADVRDSLFLDASTVRKTFVPTRPDGQISNCPRRGIRYLPKGGGDHGRPAPTGTGTRTHTTAEPTSTAAPFEDHGYLELHVVGSPSSSPSERKGCLIRLGSWYTSGTCARFRAQRDVIDPGHAALFSLSSSFSPCLINPTTGKFECTKSAAVQGIFSADSDRPAVLAYRNRTTFYADHVPQRFEKVDVFANDGGGRRTVEVEIHWLSV